MPIPIERAMWLTHHHDLRWLVRLSNRTRSEAVCAHDAMSHNSALSTTLTQRKDPDSARQLPGSRVWLARGKKGSRASHTRRYAKHQGQLFFLTCTCQPTNNVPRTTTDNNVEKTEGRKKGKKKREKTDGHRRTDSRTDRQTDRRTDGQSKQLALLPDGRSIHGTSHHLYRVPPFLSPSATSRPSGKRDALQHR